MLLLGQGESAAPVAVGLHSRTAEMNLNECRQAETNRPGPLLFCSLRRYVPSHYSQRCRKFQNSGTGTEYGVLRS